MKYYLHRVTDNICNRLLNMIDKVCQFISLKVEFIVYKHTKAFWFTPLKKKTTHNRSSVMAGKAKVAIIIAFQHLNLNKLLASL